MKILISGGGTGGHLIPGIALYEEFKKRGNNCFYLLRELDLRYPLTTRIAKSDRFMVRISGISRGVSLNTVFSVFKLLGLFFSVFGTIRQLKPDTVVLTGGYISNPVALSAFILRIPFYIAEQNSVAGMTNRFYAPFARKVFSHFPKPRKISLQKVVHTGNPSIFSKKMSPQKARAIFGFDEKQQVLAVVGGSQGARRINEAIYQNLDKLTRNGRGIIWSIGAVDSDRMEVSGQLDEIKKRYPTVRAYRFIENMDAVLCACDGMIARAGATTISELVEFEVPALFIPITHSPDNHQYLNAMFLADAGAALILSEADIDRDKLVQAIDSLFLQRESITQNIKTFRMPHPAGTIVDWIIADLWKDEK